MTNSIDFLKTILREINAVEIPRQYIAAASFTDEFGVEEVVMGDDLDSLIDRKRQGDIGDIHLILDLKSISGDVTAYYEKIMDVIAFGK
jgi:hypothetical protein